MGGEDLLFMQRKEKEEGFKKHGKMYSKKMYFFVYISGLMLYGMGSYVFLNELLASRLDDTLSINLINFFGILSIIVGLGILAFLFYQFYQRVPAKQKTRLALRNYLLIVLVSGAALGLLGETIYRITDRTYDEVKSFIWILTTYIQGEVRFIFLYYCLRLFLKKSFNWKDPILKKMLLGVFLLLSISIIVSLLVPVFGSMVMFMADLVIAIGVVYKELFQTEKLG